MENSEEISFVNDYESDLVRIDESLLLRIDESVENDSMVLPSDNLCEFFGSWVKHPEKLTASFSDGKPFRWTVIEDFLSEDFLYDIRNEFPDERQFSAVWNQAFNPLEFRYTNANIEKMGPETAKFFMLLSSPPIVECISKISNIQGIEIGNYRNCSEMCWMPRRGRYKIHTNGRKHAPTGKERRLNLIFFLNTFWCKEWKGNLEFWNEDCSEKKEEVGYGYNRAILFESTETSWHGIPDPIESIDDQISRRTLEFCYVSKPSWSESEDKDIGFRTIFRPRPDEKHYDTIKNLCSITAKKSFLSLKDRLHECLNWNYEKD